MKVDNAVLKTKLTQFAGWVKHQPLALLIPVALFIVVVLVTGFNRYKQRTATAALKSITAAQSENNGTDAASDSSTLAGVAVPLGLRAGASEQTVTCPSQAPATSVVAVVSTTFTVPEGLQPACTVTWAFYTEALQTDAGFSTKLDPRTGTFLPVGEPISVIAHGAAAAEVTVTTDGAHPVKFQHRAGDDLANAQGPFLLAAGWHRQEVTVAIIGAPASSSGFGTSKPLVIELDTGTSAPTPYWPGAASAPIPQIAQQATAPPTTVAAIAPPAAVPVAAPIQPPADIQRGFILQKDYQEDQFGSQVLIATKVVGVQALTVQAPATDTGFSGPATSVDWSAWINLTKPASLAWVRLAAGQGTVTASIDGVSLGEPVTHWQTSGPTSSMASVALAAGWHQLKIHDARAHWVNGPGVAVQIVLGDGESDPVSPQPWAVPPSVRPVAPIPQIAQHSADAPTPVAAPSALDVSPRSRNAATPIPATSTTAEGKP